jgi:hypothetical protein
VEYDGGVVDGIVDELLYDAVIENGLHAVVNVGAGLDTRPFRLPLPGDLRWIELDRDAVLLYKGLRLAHLEPSCRVERVAADVRESAARRAAIFRVCRGGVTRGLLLTENALGRLSHEDLIELGKRLPRGLKWWILAELPGPVEGNVDLLSEICSSRWEIADRLPLERKARRLIPRRLPTTPSLGWHPGFVCLLRRRFQPKEEVPLADRVGAQDLSFIRA